jgi:hypothetical protein
MIKDLIYLQKTIKNEPKKYTLGYNRREWESDILKNLGYSFSKNELDIAELSKKKIIGVVNGVECYLIDNL